MFTLRSKNIARWSMVPSLAGIILLCLSSLSAYAEDPGKIAVVDLELAVLQTEAAQKSFEEFKTQKSFKDDMDSIEADRKAYQKAREDFEKNEKVMTDAVKREKIAEITSMEEDLQHLSGKLQKKTQGLRQQIFQRFAQDALRITENIVKEQSIGLLLVKDPALVIHATADYDITNQVTERLNKL